MKTCLFSIIAMLMGCFLFAQQQLIDSLIHTLPSLKPDTQKVLIYREIAYNYASVDIEKANLYADSAIQLAMRLNHTFGINAAQYTKGVIAYYSGDQEQALVYAEQALKYARKYNYKMQQITALNFLGNIYENYNETETALNYANQSLELAEEVGSKKDIGIALYTIALLQMDVGNERLAKKDMLRALKTFQELENQRFVAIIYQGLSTITIGEEAKEYANEALAVFNETGNVNGQAHALGRLGTVFYEEEKFEEALSTWQKASNLHNSLGFSYGVASVKSNIGLLLTEMDRFEEALDYLQASKEIATSVEMEDILITTYRGLANYHAYKSNPDAVQQSIDSLMSIKDTLQSKERKNLMIQTESKYQLKEKESKLAQQELVLSRQKKQRNLILLGALVAILSLLIFLQFLRNKQKIRQQESALALKLEKTKAQQLQELDTLKSNFFTNISHEFRTPLTLILGPLEQMRDGTFTNDKQQYFDMMYRNGRRLEGLINQLLDLSKLESKTMQIKAETGNIVEFISQLAGSMESWAAHKQINYQLELPDEAIWVKFDKDKIEKILVNLLSNALKFTPPNKTVSLQLEKQSRTRQEEIIIKIKDSGIGISEEEKKRVFERFYHIDESPDDTVSSGIGLALVKELVELHQGKIEVESELGRGTTFTVLLPLQEANEAIEESKKLIESSLEKQLQNTVLLETKSLDKNSPIVLIVEDNPDVRMYIKDQLTDTYKILEAENGKLGLEIAIEKIPDLIITDVMMPEMNGNALTLALKTDERTSHIPVVMLTAKAAQTDKIEGLETGADDYLIKPFNAEELQVRVKNLIEQRRRLRERFTKESLLSPQNIAVTFVDEQFLGRLMEVIEKNMDNEGFSIENMGRQIGMSRSQLHRKIKALTDKSPSVFLRTIRLQRAKQLLLQQAGNATEIAFMIGFQNAAYFAKCFKDEFGLTPTDVLKGTAK